MIRPQGDDDPPAQLHVIAVLGDEPETVGSKRPRAVVDTLAVSQPTADAIVGHDGDQIVDHRRTPRDTQGKGGRFTRLLHAVAQARDEQLAQSRR